MATAKIPTDTTQSRKIFRRVSPKARRWALPVVVALIMTVVLHIQVMRGINHIEAPVDIGLSEIPDTYKEMASKSFKMDSPVENIPGQLGRSEPLPTIYETDMYLESGVSCFLRTKFKFFNYGTIVNISLHKLDDPHFKELKRFDLENPNRDERFHDFFDTDNFQALWEWGSNQGTNVEYGGIVTNKLSSRSMLFIRLWNKGSQPVPINGNIDVVCDS
jgi:hypothetical protein